MIEEGSIGLAVFAAVAFVGGLFVERLLVHLRVRTYFVLGFPLFPELVPIPRAPEGEGGTSSVRWEVRDDLVLFWAAASPGRRGGDGPGTGAPAPMLLHGAIHLLRGRSGVHLGVRWSPPISPLLAAAWLAGLGLARGEGALTVPIAAAMVLGVMFLYRQAALRAAAELRWAFVRDS